MKTNILLIVFAIFFFSCTQNTYFEHPPTSENPEPSAIAQDENFNSFMEIIFKISAHEINTKKLKRAIEAQNHEAIALYSGFSSLNKALEVNTKLGEIFTTLEETFQLSKLTETERRELLGNAFDVYSSKELPMKSSCASEKLICYNTAMKDFTIAAGACGAATAGAALGGPVAAGLTALVCLGAATYVLDVDRQNCNIKYDCHQ